MDKLAEILAAVKAQSGVSQDLATKLEELAGRDTLNQTEMEEMKDLLSTLESKLEKLNAGGGAPQTKELDENEAEKIISKNFQIIIKGGEKAELSNFEDGLSEKAGMNVTNDAEGKIAVTDTWDMGIIESIREQSALMSMLPVRQVKNMQLNKWVLTKHAETRWANENATNGDTTNTGGNEYAKVSGSYGKILAYPFYTREAALDPTFNLVARLKTDVGTEIGREVAKQIVTNTRTASVGTNEDNAPKGIYSFFNATESVKGDDSRSHSYAGAIKTGKAATLGDNALEIIKYLMSVKRKLVRAYRKNASWLMNENTYDMIAELTDSQGRFYLRPDLSGESEGKLLGLPVVIEYEMDDVGAGKLPIICGDPALAMEVLDVHNTYMLVDPYKKPGNFQFYYERRIGTIQADLNAIKFVYVKA